MFCGTQLSHIALVVKMKVCLSCIYNITGHVPKTAAKSIGPDAMNMIRLKQYGDMKKKIDKRATLYKGNYDIEAYGIQNDIQSQKQFTGRTANKLKRLNDIVVRLRCE